MGRRPLEPARRGLVSVGVGAPEGGGYVMTTGYIGSRWRVLWEGNGSTRITLEGDGGPGWLNLIVLLACWTEVPRHGAGQSRAADPCSAGRAAQRRRKRRAEGTAEITREYA